MDKAVKVYVKGKEWNVKLVKELLTNNDEAVIRAIKIIYSYQTEDEKACQDTHENNNVGFNKFDSDLMSSFAKQLNKGKTLSQKQLAIAHKRMPKYAQQMLNYMFKAQQQEQEEKTWAELEQKAQNAFMRMNFAVWATQEGGMCGSEKTYLYTSVDYNDCKADKEVTKVTADLTVHAWNDGIRREYNVIYEREPEQISGEDLRSYIKELHPDVDFESVADYYEVTYGRGLYDDIPEPVEPDKWQEYEDKYERVA